MANLIRRTESGSMEPSRFFDPFELMRDVMRWEPFRELGMLGRHELAFVPSFEVKETKDAYVFKADLPGVREPDLEISLTGARLMVTGKREEEKKEEGERYYAYERSYGSFTRSFTLPEGVDAEHAEAELKNGVLTVSIPKRPEVKPKKIELKAELKAGEKAKA
ncbi:Hsp20/alpha crystallin family protein [Anaeromyxobacter oryzae]|uniref:Heat-shock protein Hsp20 n=1 Tax=Anaeromyxobacter oryzae TaxID=2918170 RepID=A0ABM7WXC5_9BACT|nr:Hsp20/alpha crystallin family protein [Anaeromyxobacter oryzae]BDG04167.1 heat-shock protein Hsp20 [Anaeromyxobacter oryzae]